MTRAAVVTAGRVNRDAIEGTDYRRVGAGAIATAFEVTAH